MAVKCASCGEELMGAVNRCWRCGHEFVSPTGSSELPPVRPGANLPATSSAPPDDAEGTPHAEGTPRAEDTPLSQPPTTPTPPRGYDRVGSPFAAAGDAAYTVPRMATRVPDAVEMPVYPRHAAATGGAIAAFVLGILSVLGVLLLVSGWFLTAIGVLSTSILGIGLGIWGTYSKRRGYAIAGLLLCCLTLSISGFYCTQELYIAIYGRNPWTIQPEEDFMENAVNDGF